MSKYLVRLFDDNELVDKIKRRLPYLFQLAELESSRSGKIGMEVGSLREKIITALLIYKFGEKDVDTEIPITEPEVDVKLFKEPISIKTITSRNFSGVKLVWTVDAESAENFLENYKPICDLLFIQINWNSNGGFYYIPLKVQEKVLKNLCNKNYLKLPKQGTNPRGVEITKEALKKLIKDKETKYLEIHWLRRDVAFNPFKRWIELWKEE